MREWVYEVAAFYPSFCLKKAFLHSSIDRIPDLLSTISLMIARIVQSSIPYTQSPFGSLFRRHHSITFSRLPLIARMRSVVVCIDVLG